MLGKGILSILFGRKTIASKKKSKETDPPNDLANLSVQVEDQPYQEPDIDPTEAQIQAIEKLAEELALLQTMIKRMPGIRVSSFMRTRREKNSNLKLMNRLQNTLVLGGIMTWIFAQILNKYLDIDSYAREHIIPILSEIPLSIPFALWGAVVFGKYLESNKSEIKRREQVYTLANKMIEQYLMCREILKQALKGRYLHSLTPEKAKRLQIALGGETPPDGKLKHTFDYIRRLLTKRKRHGHIYMPGFFNSALNIDYMVRRFYESLSLTNFSQRAAQISLDTDIRKYFSDHTWNYQFLGDLIVDQQVTSISKETKKRFEKLNRIRAELVAKESMKPSHEQRYIPLEEVFPQLKPSKAPDEESNQKPGILASWFTPKISNVRETQPKTPSSISDERAHSIVFEYLTSRKTRRYEEGRNSIFSAGAVVGMLTKAILPDIDQEIIRMIELEKATP